MPVILLTSLLIASYLLTYLFRIIAIKKNVIDIPNERSSHTIPTPRGGGLSIVICWFIGLTILFAWGKVEKELFFALLSGIILAIISIIDDVIDLSPKIRLLTQATTAIVALYFLGGLEPIGFGLSAEVSLLSIVLNVMATIAVIWFINLFNFLDGIDAYASLEALFVSVALYIFTGSMLPLILIFATLGFLIWNWPKAKIFMGDVGSTQLGFILIILGIYFHNNQELHLVNWLMLSSLFWFDASYTLFRRWRNREQLSKAHKKHAFQRAVQSGYSHLKTNLLALVLNISIFCLVFYIVKYPTMRYLSFFVVMLLLFLVTKKIDRLFPFKKD